MGNAQDTGQSSLKASNLDGRDDPSITIPTAWCGGIRGKKMTAQGILVTTSKQHTLEPKEQATYLITHTTSLNPISF